MAKSWEHLLGGYATDTLTEEEKKQLFEAALHDQTLFDALADEEALKALLGNSEVRQRILASLQVAGSLEETPSIPRQQLSWFRKSSSLAWAGSIAAMGLALIFGWQMEQDWGPMVQQEQEIERVLPEDHDNNEEAFRSQASEIPKLKEHIEDIHKQDQREPQRVAGLPAPMPSRQPAPMTKTSKPSKRLPQPAEQVRSDGLLRQGVKKERRLMSKAMAPKTPESSTIVKNFAEEEERMAPALASPETEEADLQQLAQSPSFADQLEGGDANFSLSARELFYANRSTRVDAVEEKIDGMRAQQRVGGLSSIAEKALPEESVDLRGSRAVVQDASPGEIRGIRYRFVRRAVDGKDEAIDPTQLSSQWSELHLTIESNVSGHLYVLTDYGNGKWQVIRPESLNISMSKDGAVHVKAHHPVNFALSQVTNPLGKPVTSSISVLLSSMPILELGKWLGRGVRPEASGDRLTEYVSTDHFVIDPLLAPDTPLQIDIVLSEE